MLFVAIGCELFHSTTIHATAPATVVFYLTGLFLMIAAC